MVLQNANSSVARRGGGGEESKNRIRIFGFLRRPNYDRRKRAQKVKRDVFRVRRLLKNMTFMNEYFMSGVGMGRRWGCFLCRRGAWAGVRRGKLVYYRSMVSCLLVG